ncbi:large subunit ribosomal protein L7Ae [Nematocida sp. AWRm80]|nr:large subunit ribosomal protein L7Ae [Nematocida sp. AWRm80]
MQTIQTREYKKKAPKNKRGAGLKHSREDTKRENAKLEKVIRKKKAALEAALITPPAIEQFKQQMNTELKDKIEEIFMRYRPESPEDKAARLEKGEEKKQGPKVLFGIGEVVKSIERKRAKLVLIANNVDPLVVVLFLPALCKKMGVSYAIYDAKERLGAIVRRKSAACLALEEVVPGLEPLITEVNEQFSDRYQETMKTWGRPETRAEKDQN